MSGTATYEFDILRQQVMSRVVQTCGSLGMPVKLPNASFNPPTDGTIWTQFDLMMGKTGAAELGGGARQLQRTCGVAQFIVLAPENTGDGPALRLANALKRAFDKIEVNCGNAGYFKTEFFGVQPIGVNRGFYRILVDGPLDFFSRNSDAPQGS